MKQFALAGASALALLTTPAGAATLDVAFSFSGANGSAPAGRLLLGDDGSFYGTTRYGGAAGLGTVFRFDPVTSHLTTLASIAGGAAGDEPEAQLYRAPGGALYGTTLFGGTYNGGTIFRLDPGAPAVTTLASLANAQGASLLGPLVPDGAGNLYGPALYGGAHEVPPYIPGDGTIFRYGAGGVTVASEFGGAAGSHPNSGLLRTADGSLYGTTDQGGAGGYGTIFRLAPGADAVTPLYSFDGTMGKYLFAGLVADGAGNLYGSTGEGGTDGRGTLFRYSLATGQLTTLANFDAATGNGASELLIDAAGDLFGTSANAGASNDGTVFRLAAGSSQIETLFSFSEAGPEGYSPLTGLTADADGTLYGTTFEGGAGYSGTIFRIRDAGFVTGPSGVPEPATWATMLAGFAAVGAALRRRPTRAAARARAQ